MAFLLFIGALVAIVLCAMIVNRLTGTKALYLETLQLESGEREIWRDARADFAVVPRLGQAVSMSFARMRRHTVLWTDRRIIVSQKPLFSSKHMITHQIHFTVAADSDAPAAAREVFGGFYGRGFETIEAEDKSFGQVNRKDCVRIKPTPASGAKLNLEEMLIFTDHLPELQTSLA